jgi:hypothetical protein
MMLRKWMAVVAFAFLSLTLVAAQEKTTGGLKGRVRAENGATVAGVTVILRQNEREVARVETNRKGEFVISGLKPGAYGLTFRKPGLSVGRLENIEVRAGKVRELVDRLILSIDEATIAYVRGSVFTADGHSAKNVRVELYRIDADGSEKKLEERLSSEETGQFSFRVSPDPAKYRIVVRAKNVEPMRGEVVSVDGPAIYRTAISLPPLAK